jgi:hypothetical protein
MRPRRKEASIVKERRDKLRVEKPKKSPDISPTSGAASAQRAPSPLRRQVRDWVISYFSSEFHVPPGRISAASPLRLWGYAEERTLASLAAAFNQTARTRPQWHNAHVTPPDLISAVNGKTIGDLIDFLSDQLATSAVNRAAAIPLLAETAEFQLPITTTDELKDAISNWMLKTELEKFVQSTPITPDSKFPILFANVNFFNDLVWDFDDAAPDFNVNKAKLDLDPTQFFTEMNTPNPRNTKVQNLIDYVFNSAERAFPS